MEHRAVTGDASDIEENAIVERIYDAVMDQRLPAGVKLSESALCEAFGTGRMRIRRSLLLLASRGVVELHPNRGAYVASPTPAQAREVFEARLALEPNLVVMAAERASDADLALLSRLIEAEGTAHAAGHRHDAIRLSGQFHTQLAELAGNSVMARMVRELIAQTSLIIGLFGAPGVTNCRDDDHTAIAAALQARDGARAADLIRAHLQQIQSQLQLDRSTPGTLDVMSVFRSG